jgi:hypothetical protein
MNRLFNAKIETGSCMLLAAILAATIFLVWTLRNGIVICIMLLLLTVMVERIIHTNYTITPDGKLIVHTGRFSKDKIIDLSQAASVRQMAAMRIFGKPIRTFVIIECKDGQVHSFIPKEEEKFVKHVSRIIEDQD